MQEGCMQEGCMQEDCMQEDCMQEGCMLGNYRWEMFGLHIVGILEGYRRKVQMAEQNRTADRNTVDPVSYRKTKQQWGYHILHLHQECELGRHRHARDHARGHVRGRVRGRGARDVHVHPVIAFRGWILVRQ